MAVTLGVHLHLASHRDRSGREVLEFARQSEAAGLRQIWVSDNLECRSATGVLTALAQTVGVDLGGAVFGQYFRHPAILANALTWVSELLGARQLVAGLGTGNPSTPRYLHMPHRVSFMEQYASCLAALLSGEEVLSDTYPLLVQYFNLAPHAILTPASKAATEIPLFGGGNGPLGLALAGRRLDGVILGPSALAALAAGKLAKRIEIADEAAAASGRGPLRYVMLINCCVGTNHLHAREFARKHPTCGRLVRTLRQYGFDDEDLSGVGIEPGQYDRLDAAYRAGGPYADFSGLVTDAMVDAMFIAGDPKACRERLEKVVQAASGLGIEQVIFAAMLGPDPSEAIRLLGKDVVPAFAGA